MNPSRDLAPRVLGALVRRYGDFANAEDAVQEALIAATAIWPEKGEPNDPQAWLVRAASRRLVNHYRADAARRRRERLAASWSVHAPAEPMSGTDDTLMLMVLCSHPILTPLSAIPLTLRAVGGLTTYEIAAAFLVSEPTMAQRISRAKAKLRGVDEQFRLPLGADIQPRLRSVRHVLYLMFNEGYATSAGPELGRSDLALEAIRLTQMLLESTPDEAEVHGLMGLMLLSEARRPARTTSAGALVPLAEQDRSRWDRDLVQRGIAETTAAIRIGPLGEYGLQAAINALHAEAPSYEGTRWADISALYERLERLTGNPVVRLNRAVAVAMTQGPAAGLELLADLDEALWGHHRLSSVRAHLHELGGDATAAADGYRVAASRTLNFREREFLLMQAARVSTYGCHANREG